MSDIFSRGPSRRYQITMKVAAFGCVNKQQLSRNFLWLSPQQNFLTLFREANFHANFRKAVIEISLFPAIFRSNIRAAFQTVARIFVLTEAIDVSKIRTKFRFTRNFVIFRRKVPKFVCILFAQYCKFQLLVKGANYQGGL